MIASFCSGLVENTNQVKKPLQFAKKIVILIIILEQEKFAFEYCSFSPLMHDFNACITI